MKGENPYYFVVGARGKPKKIKKKKIKAHLAQPRSNWNRLVVSMTFIISDMAQ